MPRKRKAPKPQEADPPLPTQVKIDYIKSNLFRTVHSDGVYGGVSPAGKIFMAFWNTRVAIPQQIVHTVQPDGAVGDEIRDRRVSRGSIIRETEVGVIMDLEMAKQFSAWLDEQIHVLEEARKERDKD